MSKFWKDFLKTLLITQIPFALYFAISYFVYHSEASAYSALICLGIVIAIVGFANPYAGGAKK